jgi:mannosylglycerate hydrolase
MAVVDDYLEVRPEMEQRLRRLAASGRVSVGPWYILVDEFLVSAETIVRDLQLGIERASAFGGATSIGYLPDMFGHIAQMPQILAQAGFADTAVWRGVPSAVTKSGFNWVAPDGTAIRAEYLVTGYGNGASLPTDAKALVQRVNDYLAGAEKFLLGDLLLMNGSDHLPPQRHLGRVVSEANSIQDDLRFKVTSLAEYLAGAPREGLETWHGELRSGYRANVLMGVLSNRVDVKLLASSTEVAMEHRAEPYAALLLPPARYPSSILRIAWREIIRNAAHDSICACSVDETVDAVLHRFYEARQIANGVARRALDEFAASLTDRAVVVVNPYHAPRGGLVETVVTGDEFDPAAMQLIEEHGSYPDAMLLDVEALRAILSTLQGTKLSDDAWVHAATLGEDGDVLTLDVTLGAHERVGVDIDEIRQQLAARMRANPAIKTRVTLDQPPIRRVVGHVEAVPGYGWAPFTAATPTHPVRALGTTGLANGLVRVEFDDANGTFSVDGLSGYGRLVDVGDLGDSYNYSPPVEDAVVDTPEAVSIVRTEDGPLRGRTTITATYRWPERIEPVAQRRTGSVPVVVTTMVEIRADEPHVRVETTFVNPARDHRLRVHLPLPTATDHSVAECAFTVVTRGLTAEGRPSEFGLPTFPSRRFVVAGGLTVAHQGLHEYELVGISDGRAHELAITVLRSTGMLSRLGMAYRPLPAGPLIEVEGLQMVGSTITAKYALAASPVDPYDTAASLLVPLEAVAAPGGGTRPMRASALDVRGAQVSAVQRVEGVLEVRVFNPTNDTATVELPGRHGWLVDLRGRGLDPFEGRFTLRGHGIATLRLHDDG